MTPACFLHATPGLGRRCSSRRPARLAKDHQEKHSGYCVLKRLRVQITAAATLFAVCDGQYERVFALRSQWSKRGLAISYLSWHPKERVENQSEFNAFARSGITESFVDGLIAAGSNCANCPLHALFYLDHAALRSRSGHSRAKLRQSAFGCLNMRFYCRAVSESIALKPRQPEGLAKRKSCKTFANLRRIAS